MESKWYYVNEKTCEFCKRKFESRRKDAKCCSNACRQQIYLARSAPQFVEKQIPYIEDEIRRMEKIPSYLTKQNVENTFEMIRNLVNHWHYRKLPRKHKLEYYVEVTLVKRVEALRAKLRRAS